MPTRFDPNIFVIFGTYFAQLKRRAHFAIQFILFLSDLNVIFWRGMNRIAQIWVNIPSVRIQITANKILLVNFKVSIKPSDAKSDISFFYHFSAN